MHIFTYNTIFTIFDFVFYINDIYIYKSVAPKLLCFVLSIECHNSLQR